VRADQCAEGYARRASCGRCATDSESCLLAVRPKAVPSATAPLVCEVGCCDFGFYRRLGFDHNDLRPARQCGKRFLLQVEPFAGELPGREALADGRTINRLLKNVQDGALSSSKSIPSTAVGHQLDEKPRKIARYLSTSSRREFFSGLLSAEGQPELRRSALRVSESPRPLWSRFSSPPCRAASNALRGIRHRDGGQDWMNVRIPVPSVTGVAFRAELNGKEKPGTNAGQLCSRPFRLGYMTTTMNSQTLTAAMIKLRTATTVRMIARRSSSRFIFLLHELFPTQHFYAT